MAWPSSGASRAASRQRRALGDGELQLDEVEPGDQLGDRVLDLQPGVHLEEPEPAVGLEEELDGAGADVADGRGGGDRGVGHPPAQLGVDGRGRRLLDDLLVAALDRALPLVQRHDVAVGVGEDLDLDVAAALDVALAEHGAVAERRRRPPAAAASRASSSSPSVRTMRMPRPPPPADALTSSGRPISAGVGHGGVEAAPARRRRASAPWPRSSSPSRRSPPGGGPIHVSPASVDGPGEVGRLGEEPVAGVDGVGAGAPGGVDQQVGAQVGVGRRRARQVHGGVAGARRGGRRRRRR